MLDPEQSGYYSTPADKMRGILQSARERVKYFPELRRKVNEASNLTDFSFTVWLREDEKDDFERVAPSESDANKVFELPFEVGSATYYSFLKSLQDIGFDLYALLSMPKGDVFSVTHGSLPRLKQVIRRKSAQVSRYPEFSSKLNKRDFLRAGQLHVRIYSHDGKTFLTAHIDPPDLKDHLSPRAQLSGSTKADYPNGEDLLQATLQMIHGRDEN